VNESTDAAPPRRPGLWAVFALILAVLLIVGGLLWYAMPSDEAPAPAQAAAPEPSPASLATTIGEEGTLQIDVMSLERVSPGTLELRLAVTHIGSEATALDIAQRFSADGPDRGTLSEVYLADLAHQRKLFILRDAEGMPIGSRDERPLAPGERREVWAHFPAPTGSEDAVVVHVPHAEPMPNVPITNGDAVGATGEDDTDTDAGAGQPDG
jgi:hypothetical protein